MARYPPAPLSPPRAIPWPEPSPEDEDEDEEPLSPECRDLIGRLLDLDPRQRLGHRGAAEVKLHPWFEARGGVEGGGGRWRHGAGCVARVGPTSSALAGGSCSDLSP